MGKKLSLDAKQIVLGVFSYHRTQNPAESINRTVSYVSRATKVSRASIYRYLKEKKTTGLRPPLKNLKRLKRVTGISDLAKCKIRRTIYKFHETEKVHVKSFVIRLSHYLKIN